MSINNIKNITVMLTAVLLMGTMLGCEFIEYRSPANNGAYFTSKKVDKILALAKEFAQGIKTAAEVKSSFDELSADELNQLVESQNSATNFSLLMVLGLASSDSLAVVEKYLNAPRSPEATTRTLAFGADLVKVIRSKKRPAGEDIVARKNLLTTLLMLYPQQVNQYVRSDGTLDQTSFNELVDVLDPAQAAAIIPKLSQAHLNEWYEWTFEPSNKVLAQAAFKSFYHKLPTFQQEMRNRLLLSSYVANHSDRLAIVASLIREADLWGIKAGINTDLYELPSTIPGDMFKGSMMHVLTMRAIADNNLAGATPWLAYQDLRVFAAEFKAILPNPALDYPAHVRVANWGTVARPAIVSIVLSKALAISHRENFANYYLHLDQPNDVLLAAERADVSLGLLKELYHLVIDTDAKAVALGPLAHTTSNKSFIHHLVGRTVDTGLSYGLLDQFLTSAFNHAGASAAGELAQLGNHNGGAYAIQLLLAAGRTPGDNVTQKNLMLNRLLKHDDGTGVNNLTSAQLQERADLAYQLRGLGLAGKNDFKTLYAKLNTANQKHLRDHLLAQAIADVDANSGIKAFIDHLSSWGLNSTLNTDTYTIGGNTGSLLYVLTKKAIADHGTNPNSYKQLRGYAASIKNTLTTNGQNYAVYTALNFSGETVKGALSTGLGNKKQFAGYYLSSEDPSDVLEAASQSETGANAVSNKDLKELYTLVISDNAKAALLGKNPANTADKNFLGLLLSRSADAAGDSLYLLNNFLSSIYAEAAKLAAPLAAVPIATPAGIAAGINAERAQLNYAQTSGEKPFSYFVSPRLVSDNPANRKLILERVLKHAQATAISANISNMADAGKLIPMLKNDPVNFKLIYSNLTANLVGAKAMHNALLMDAYGSLAVAPGPPPPPPGGGGPPPPPPGGGGGPPPPGAVLAAASGSPAATRKLLTKISDAADHWGLLAAISTGEFTLPDRTLTNPAITGSLLYVLTKRAMEEVAAVRTNDAYNELNSFAKIIRNALANYATYATAVGATTGFSPLTLLETALPGVNEKPFAKVYLNLATVQDVYDSVKTMAINNHTLKRLYAGIIGNNRNLAYQLSQLNAGHRGFINHLVERKADNHLAWILDKFLTSLFSHGGLTGERAELNRLDAAGKSPIEILASATRVADEGLARAKMLGRLAQYDNGPALNISVSDLDGLQFFNFGQIGQTAFKNLYQAIATSPNQTKAMRSNLLYEAYLKDKTLKTFITDLNLPDDAWNLASTLNADDYVFYRTTLTGSRVKLAGGNLLYVLSYYAIDSDNDSEYKNLSANALKIKTTLALAYNAYAANSLLALKAKLDPIEPARAEVLLHFPVNEDMLMESVSSGIKFDFDFFDKLYKLIIKDSANAHVLSTKFVSGSKFIHLIIQKTPPSAKNYLKNTVDNFLNLIGQKAAALPGASPSAAEDAIKAEIESTNSTGKNALMVILSNTKNGPEHNQIIKDWALRSKTAVSKLNSKAEIVSLFTALALSGASQAEFETVLANIDDARMADAGIWALENIDSYPQAAPAFKLKYALRPKATIKAVHNAIIKAAYDNSSPKASNKLTTLQSIVKAFKLIDDTLLGKKNFDPFTKGYKSTLLYAIMEHVDPNNKTQWDTVTSEFKKIITTDVDWKNYLDKNINENDSKSTLAYWQPKYPTGMAEGFLGYPAKEQIVYDYLKVIPFDTNMLKSLYDNAIKNDTNLTTLSNLGISGDRFIHRLIIEIAKKPDFTLSVILKDYLKRVYDQAESTFAGSGKTAVDDLINKFDGVGNNPLQHFLIKAPVTNNYFNSIAYLLSYYADFSVKNLSESKSAYHLIDNTYKIIDPSTRTKLLNKLTPSSTNTGDAYAKLFLVDTIKDFPIKPDLKNILSNIFIKLPDSSIKGLAQWCAIFSGEKDINTLFKNKYDGQSEHYKTIMRNVFIKSIHELSKNQNKSNARNAVMFSLLGISQAIAKGFFDADTLKSADFDPFSKGAGKTLLYYLVAEYNSHITFKRDLRKITDALKDKGNFSGAPGDSWNEYLEKDSPQTIVNLVNNTRTHDLDTAKTWLQWD